MGLLKNIKDALQGKAQVGELRSSKWPTVRKKHLLKNPACSVCGGQKSLEVHHIVPFNIDPSRELDPKNLITLCESKTNGVSCHLFFGHLGNYKSYNARVESDAKAWSGKLRKRP
jgi:5-methylcytosine-specific restriction enzyme A